MQNIFRVPLLSVTILVGGCSAYPVGSQIQAGGQDLLVGKSASAAAYFQEAANLDPNYERSIGYMRGPILAGLTTTPENYRKPAKP